MSQSPWRLLGGPLGAHASARSASARAWATLAILAASLPVLAALLLRGWCLVNGFVGQVPLWRMCYSDLPTAFAVSSTGGVPSEPIVTAAALKTVALLVSGEGLAGQSTFVILWGLLAMALLAVGVLAITALRNDDPSRALLLVLCPALPTTLLISADIFGLTLTLAGVLAWRLGGRGENDPPAYDLIAGLLLTLAVFARSYALLAVLVLLTLAWRQGTLLTRGGRLAAGAAIAGVVIGLLTAILGRDALLGPIRAWWDVVPGYGSLLQTLTLPYTNGVASGVVSVASAVAPWLALAGWIAAIVVVAWTVRSSWRTPAFGDVAVVGLAIVLLTSSAVPVQASLWLIPLIALSSLPWRDMLLWAGAEVAYYGAVWLYIGGLANPTRGLPPEWYAFLTLIRIVAIGYIGYRAFEAARYGVPTRAVRVPAPSSEAASAAPPPPSPPPPSQSTPAAVG